HPNSRSAAHQIGLRDKADSWKATVLAVVSIVTHKKIMSRRHDRIEVCRAAIGGKHDQVTVTELLETEPRAAKTIPARINAGRCQWNRRTIDAQTIVPHRDVVTRQSDQPLDVVDRGICG